MNQPRHQRTGSHSLPTRGSEELEAAVQAARAAMDAESELEAVFVTVGCRMEDAVRLARSKYVMRLCVPDEDAENPIDWSGPLLALAHQQSEGALLDGCLVGLFMAGPLAQTMDPMALQTAEKRLTAEILEEEQRTYERHSLDDRIRRQNIDPDALRSSSMSAAARFAQPLLKYEMTGPELAQSVTTLGGLWAVGVEIATKARGEHQQA